MTNQYSYAEDFAVKPVEIPHKKTATPNISSAAKIYMMNRMQKENAANNYRSGNNNGQRYMTSEDFVTYFRSRDSVSSTGEKAEGARPSAPVQKKMSSVKENKPGEILRSASGQMPTRESVARGNYPRSNIGGAVKINKSEPVRTGEKEDVKIYVPTAKARKNFETRVFSVIETASAERIKAMRDEWIPKDEVVVSKKNVKSRGFKKAVLGIAGVAISLLLIVSGSVMLNNANREVKRLENEFRTLEQEEEMLRVELDMKNDINILRERATNDLGMIDKQYVEASYLNTLGGDSIQSHEGKSENNIGLSTILSAFGIN